MHNNDVEYGQNDEKFVFFVARGFVISAGYMHDADDEKLVIHEILIRKAKKLFNSMTFLFLLFKQYVVNLN